MRNNQSFGKLDILISFIILFMIDLYKDNHVHACERLLTFFKKHQKLLTVFLPNFTGMFLRYRLKISLHCYRKIRPVERYRRSSASSIYKLAGEGQSNKNCRGGLVVKASAS